jgi:hypothetical protein
MEFGLVCEKSIRNSFHSKQNYHLFELPGRARIDKVEITKIENEIWFGM